MAFSKTKNTAPIIDGVTGEVNIEVDAADGDNVSIANADGTKKASITSLGSKNGLDVVVIDTDNYAVALDDTSTANVTYVGYAAIGASQGAAAWRIKRIDETSGMVITWADSNSSFDNVWSNRTALTYG